jgi:hypothetical protein
MYSLEFVREFESINYHDDDYIYDIYSINLNGKRMYDPTGRRGSDKMYMMLYVSPDKNNSYIYRRPEYWDENGNDIDVGYALYEYEKDLYAELIEYVKSMLKILYPNNNITLKLYE